MKKYDLFFLIFILFLFITKFIDCQTQEKEKQFFILTSDKDFNKPMSKLNAEFELIQMKNGLKCLLIYDPFTTVSHIHLETENGCFTDTTPSISHLAEHMIFGGSKSYQEVYPLFRTIGGAKLYSGGAITGQTDQEYFYTIPYNFKFDKVLSVFIDAFKHPLFSEEIIKKEIQTINSEFYLQIDEPYHLIDAIIRQLCTNKTSCYGFTAGNNNTLNPDESWALSKKLKSYHNIVNKPENIFFLIYSNQTIKEMENYAVKYLNYEMYKFSENETDKIEGEKLLKNIYKFEKFEIFDDNLYEHGIYYNSHDRKNYVDIFFHVGDINLKDLQFDVFEYFSYLFKSESLIRLLKQKNYICSMNNIDAIISILVKNNSVFNIDLELTENGLNNLKDVLLIIYKYINIIKREGFKREYFNNFIKFKQNKNNKDFQKEMFNILTTFSNFIENYRSYGVSQIFTYGTPKYDMYDQNKLKQLLNRIKYEKSFFITNTVSKATELKTFLKSPSKRKLKYYNVDYLLGKIPNDFIKEINERNYEINDKLSMRKINPYFGEKYGKVIPCYKQEINRCKELNEFDYELEDKYNGTLLANDKNYIIYYQIDKSSETYIVYSYLELQFIENDNITTEVRDIIKMYLNNKFTEINEVPTISIDKLDKSSIEFTFKTFTDNTDRIFKDFISYLKQEPNIDDFNYSKISVKAQNIEKDNVNFREYIFDIGNRFLGGGASNKKNIEEANNQIDNLNFEDFKQIYKNILNKINLVSYKIAGNIDTNLVQILSDYLKENIKIHIDDENNLKTCEDKDNDNDKDITDVNMSNLQNENNIKNSDTPKSGKKRNKFSFIVDYYQKSTMVNERDGGIFIIYRFEDIFKDYMNVLKGCLEKIVKINLRFKYSHSYHPKIYLENNFLMIFEQGRYKEPTQMEDEINEVLSGMIEGNIKCDNYKDIVKSYKLKQGKKEKNPLSLFKKFIGRDDFENEDNDYIKKKMPKSFGKFVKKISSIFTEPERYTILVTRNDMPDREFNEIMNRRKQNAKYILNENVKIIYTNNIEFLKPRN